jgi:hypothetical protein
MHARISFFALLLWPALVSAGAKLAVLPIEHTGLRADLVPTLTAVLSVELERTGAFEVMSIADLESILDFERQRDIFECADAMCLAEVGGALGVDRVLRTHIGRVGSAYVLDMTVINIREGRSEARAYQGAVARPEALIGLIRSSVAQLVKPADPVPVELGPVVEARSSVANPVAWLTAGVGAAAMVTGGVLRQSSDSRRLAGDLTLGIGAAVTLAGLVMLGIEREADHAAGASAHIAPTAFSDGLGFVFAGSF